MPLNQRHIAMTADRAAALAVAGKRFGEQVAIRLAACLEPDGIIVVLADVDYLDIAHDFAVIHHGKATRPAVIEHPRLCDTLGAAHERPCRLAVLAHYPIARIAERVAVLGHERQLFFQLVGRPEVVAVEEGHPFAAGFAQAPVPADRRAAVLGVFEVTDFGREIPAFAGMTCCVHFGKLSELFNDFVGVVGAGVVYDNQFPVRVGLGQHGPYRFGDEPAGIVAGHNYGDQAVHAKQPLPAFHDA